MTSMLRISEAASLGLHAVVLMARRPDKLLSTHEIAQALGASEAHLAKVLQRLTRAALVRSVRGPRGGHALARPSGRISLLEVYEAVEGKVPSCACLYTTRQCGGRRCIFGDLLTNVNTMVRQYLDGTRLGEVLDAGWKLS